MVLEAMAILEQQQAMLVDCVGGDTGRRVFVRREGEQQLVVEQVDHLDITARIRRGKEDAVELATVERVARRLAGFLAQEQLQIGPAAAQPRQDRREQERGDGGDHPHAQFAGQGEALGARHVGEFLGLAQHTAGLFGDAHAERSKADDAARALDEGDADQRLELAQAGRERRLGDEAAFGGLAEVAIVAQRDEILELLDGGKIDYHSRFRSM